MNTDQFMKLGISIEWYIPLSNAFALFGIDTPLRQSAFLAQCYHESSGFNILEENLHYSSKGLLATWPTRFTQESASQYADNPEKIANKVYAGRMGNGDEASGDGWKYRGRGPIQITGKANYSNLSKDTGVPFIDNPDLMLIPSGGATSAGWFWEKNNLNTIADVRDWVALTKKINGAVLGLDDRINKTNQFMAVLSPC